MTSIDDEILDAYSKKVQKLSEEYQRFIESKFNKHVLGTSSVFYPMLNNFTSRFQNQVIQKCIEGFKSLCAAAGVALGASVLKRFTRSVSFYIKHAFSQYKNIINFQFSKVREELLEAKFREGYLKRLLEARVSAANFMLNNKDIIISVGKRSYHLSNYVRIVMESEAASKFVLQTVLNARKDGAIGIKISDHNTVCRICDEFEGKTYLFNNGDFAKLYRGLPPFHPNCRHFIIPVYANN